MELWGQFSLDKKLMPLYGTDYDKVAKIKTKTEYLIKIIEPRNPKFHRKAFALFQLGFQNQEKINSFPNYRNLMTIKAGFYTIEMSGDKQVPFADSLSYSSMDNNKFAEVYSKVLDVIAKELGLGSSEVDEEIISFM
jgi:hypothetical protein